MRKPRCSICGRFVALCLGEGEPGRVVVDYTPDCEYQEIDYPETFEYTHVRCLMGDCGENGKTTEEEI